MYYKVFKNLDTGKGHLGLFTPCEYEDGTPDGVLFLDFGTGEQSSEKCLVRKFDNVEEFHEAFGDDRDVPESALLVCLVKANYLNMLKNQPKTDEKYIGRLEYYADKLEKAILYEQTGAIRPVRAKVDDTRGQDKNNC